MGASRFFGSLHTWGRSFSDLGPLPGAVQDAQDSNGIASDAISGDKGCAGNDQFACALDASGTTAVGELRQTLNLYLDAPVDRDRGSWAVLFDVVEDRVAVCLRRARPFEPHGLRF